MIIDGTGLAAQVRERVANDGAALLRERGIVPGLAVVLVGDDPASAIYVRRKGRMAREAGIRSIEYRLPADTPEEELPSSRFRKAKVYVDCNSFGPRAIEAAVSLYGAERIVCGTDGSEFGCDWTRKALAEAQIGEEAREQILRRNAAAMLARVATTARREMAAE